MGKQFLDETGLQTVADKVNTRLKTVTTMPANPHNNQIVLYIGESGMVYTKGCIYKYNGNTWTNITPSLIVEQNYDPESVNAQSGTAVAQAQNVLMNKLFSRNTWESKTWYGDIDHAYGLVIWTDGINYYYSNSELQFVLDKATSTWTTKTWNGYNEIYAGNIWVLNGDYYYSGGTNEQYVLDVSTSTWSPVTWNGYTDIYGYNIWSDGDNIYYSDENRQYVLNKTTNTWETKTWYGLTRFTADYIWKIDNNIYYSDGSRQYVLNRATDTWETMTWNINISSPANIWSDNDGNIYYSVSSDQYILDKTTMEWKPNNNWNGLDYFDGRYIWSDGDNIYYSDGDRDYILTLILKTYID